MVMTVCYLGPMDISAALKQLRSDAGLTQEELGERLEVGKMWVHYRESGRTRTSIEEAERWAEACGRSMEIRFANANRPRSPEAVSVADLLVERWGSMDPAERRLLADMIRLAARR